MNRRNAVSAEIGGDIREVGIGRHWFAEARGEDRALFEGFTALKLQPAFEPGPLRRRMHRSWQARGDTGYWEFDRSDYDSQYLLPERFSGLV